MMYLTRFFIVFLITLLLGSKHKGNSKSDSLQEKEIIAPNLKMIIDNYIAENPLESNRTMGKSSVQSGFSYPSYHLFFNKKGMDTIFSIVLFPDYNNFELEGDTNNDNETTYKSIEHKGWTMYKEKYPIIIFDDNDYSSNSIESDKLSFKIPDSLKAGYNNQHNKFVKWDYKIHNNFFERMD